MNEAISHDTGTHRVGVNLRVVANGFDPASGRLRATLVATPRKLRDGETMVRPVRVEHWPVDVVSYMEALAKGGEDQFPLMVLPSLGAKPERGLTPAFLHLGADEVGLAKASEIWASAFTNVSKTAWAHLLADIDRSETAKKQTTDSLNGKYGDFEEGVDPIDEAGALQVGASKPSEPLKITAVVANPQTQHAVEVEAARAQRVCAQLAGAPQPVAGSELAPPPISKAMSSGPGKPAVDAGKRAAFKSRFEAMVRHTDDSRGRTRNVFETVGSALGTKGAIAIQLGRPLTIRPYAPHARVHGQGPTDEAEKFAPRAGHVYGSWPQRPKPNAVPAACATGALPPDEDASLQSIYFTLQGDPLLSRLFGFAFDMTFHVPEGEAGERTIYLGGEKDGVLTAALLGAREGDGYRTFWPAPREFAAADPGIPRNEQRHGVYRFDDTQLVTSVDVRGAVSDAPDGVDRGGPHQTAGFNFLDGIAADRAARDLAVAKKQQHSFIEGDAPIVLHAEELAIGRRLDVGVKGQWRSLMYRYVGHPGLNGAINKRLSEVATGFEPASPRGGRRYLEETSFQRLARAIPTVGGQGVGGVEAIIEEAYLTWGGAPLGALACKPGENASGGRAIMPVSRSYDLPGAEFGNRRPPPLRYGVGYRFGMRACYLGGGGPSLSEAVPHYRSDADAVLPNDGKQATAKRFLRHEAIAAPILMLPACLVEVPMGPMGFEPPATAILRTPIAGDAPSSSEREEDPLGPAYIKAGARSTGRSTYRVLVAPMVGLDFCARHGVFDDPKTSSKLLSGGLLDVRFLDMEVEDAADRTVFHRHTGFPLAKVSRREGFNADQVIYRRELGGLDAKSDEALGAAVFQSREAPDSTRVPGRGYLPDPAARHMSLRVRIAESDLYLAGDVCVPLYDANSPGFPHAMPVLIEVRKQDRLRPDYAERAADVIECLGSKRFRFDAHAVVPSRSGVQVQHVRVTLCRCEQFDIEVTCLPGAGELANWFSVVETIGVQTLQAQIDPTSAELRKAAYGLETADRLDKEFGILKKGTDGGLANAAACDKEGHQTISKRLLTFMRETQPLPEIAAASVLRVAHAVNAPVEAPRLMNVAVARTDEKAPMPVKVPFLRVASEASKPVRFKSRPGATHMLLTGAIEVDLEQVGALEINAYAVGPDGTPFDDAARGRGLLSRRAGRWPSAPSNEGKRSFYLKRAVFGFNVAPDGKSRLVTQKLTLLRIENLPDPRVALKSMELYPGGIGPNVFLGMRGRKIRLDLGALHLAALNGSSIQLPRRPGDPSAGTRTMSLVRPHDIADTRARLLSLEVVGISRFARAFETAPMYDKHGKEHVLERRRPLRARDQRKTAEPILVCSSSTVRPSATAPRTPLPYFRIERSALGSGEAVRQSLSRKCGVRLRFERGWFSAGEQERVGIVLWPPRYLDQKPEDLERNKVKLNDRTLDLSDLMDADLGDGGPFVSRWGGDPIRADLEPQRSWFIPPTAFSCLDKGEVDEYVSAEPGAPERAHAPRFVSSVEMPIEISPENAEDPTALRKSALKVSLLTFEPYFDIEAEEWYVDVPFSLAKASDPFIRLGLVRYQPNAILDDLKVSTPTRVWTQLPPHREVLVTSQRGRGVMQVTAVAHGQASAGVKPLPIDVPALMEKLAKPRMRLTVFHESDDALGVRRQISLGRDQGDDGVSPQLKDGEFQWVISAKIEDAELQNLPSGHLVAWIEEIEHRLPATYPLEPCTFENAYRADQTVASGPRFLAKVPFRQYESD